MYNINEWLLMDTIDPGYQILLDDEIFSSVLEEGNIEGEENETKGNLNRNRIPIGCYSKGY